MAQITSHPRRSRRCGSGRGEFWRHLRKAAVDYQTSFLGRPPVEARLRLPATELMYEVCRVQKLQPSELNQFDDAFIDHLFEMVEITRDHQDETLNYSVIKLIVSYSFLIGHRQLKHQVALNEQFMVATLPAKEPEKIKSAPIPQTATFPSNADLRGESRTSPTTPTAQRNHHLIRSGTDGEGETYTHDHSEDAKKLNRVLIVLMRRLYSSKTFGENVIFMLNRAGKWLLTYIPTQADQQKTLRMICVCNCSSSKFSICCSLPPERRNISTPTI
jgi:hypothetical protein